MCGADQTLRCKSVDIIKGALDDSVSVPFQFISLECGIFSILLHDTYIPLVDQFLTLILIQISISPPSFTIFYQTLGGRIDIGQAKLGQEQKIFSCERSGCPLGPWRVDDGVGSSQEEVMFTNGRAWKGWTFRFADLVDGGKWDWSDWEADLELRYSCKLRSLLQGRIVDRKGYGC